MVIDDSKPNPSAVRSQLREMEDFNMALRLQDEEFGHHYDQNRSERRTVGNDTKHSKVVQQTEDETARAMRRQAFRQIEETDEQIAQRLAAEWNAEESRKAEEKIRQELIDEEYARRLTESGEFSASSSGMNPDVMTGSTSSYQNALSGSSSASSYQAQVPPYQPPSYDFAVREQPPQDLLIDFSSQPSNVPPAPVSYPQSNQTSTPRGIPLPGLAPSTILPPSHLPQATSASLVSQPSIDSPIAWPAPPPSVLAPTNPFLADLTSTNTFSVAPSSAVPSSIGFVNPPSVGFHSEFGLPPPSSLALGQPRQLQ